MVNDFDILVILDVLRYFYINKKSVRKKLSPVFREKTACK